MIDLTALPVHILAQQTLGDWFANSQVFVLFGGIMLAAYFLLLRPEQKKQAEAQKMIAALKKNDRVETIGGILGTVVSVKKDSQEVVLRLDDKTGAEIRVRMRAIAGVISKETKASDNAES